MREVAPGVIRVRAPLPYASPAHVNCYLLLEEDGATLVDTGMLGGENALDRAIEQAGVTIARVVLTHGHPDHWGLASRFGRPVVAHAAAASHMRFEDDPRAELAIALPGRDASDDLIELMLSYRRATLAVPEVHPVADGDRIGAWTVLETPGHAPDHICLLRDDGVMLSGDHLLPDVTPNINLSRAAPHALDAYLTSLARTAALQTTLVLPAHGEPFTSASAQSQRMIAHHERRLALIERILQVDGDIGPARLIDAVFGTLRDPHDQVLAEMEIHAHVEHLRRRVAPRASHPELSG